MHGVSCCSGGVMFVEDEIERKPNSISYKEFIKEEGAEQKKRKLFGRKPAEVKQSKKASRTAA